jgi:hypothetical protein
MDYLKEYCDATSLHGWFFYGGSSSDKKTSISGFFWLAVLVGSMSAAVFVMGTTIQGLIIAIFSVKTYYISKFQHFKKKKKNLARHET